MRKLMLIIIVLFLASPVSSKEIAGVMIEDTITNKDGKQLLLNGAGIRKKLFFKIYVTTLYLEKKLQDAESVIKAPGAKRVGMHFIYDKVTKDKVVSAWKEGFKANVAEASLASLQPRIDKFNAMFDQDMVEGDTIIFDYIPGKGTEVSIKGTVIGTIEGKDFNDALLSIWLGDEPVGSDLKKSLLGE